ncbi:MAG TPA: hypothetical protein VGB19_11100 [Actinomycetota bacterium]
MIDRITRSTGSTIMRRMQIQHRTGPRRDDSDRVLPLDPRDPAVLRAKQLKRSAPLAGKASR